ncbi:MAG TPA: protein kinase [Candidatus Acidoferrum sp.]|nr:protein kinase [Candidatus Acidoferrum sp.]
MGAVYKARQKELDRIVALKILPTGIGNDPAFAGRFAREARALAKLNHPGIVTLYEFGQANGLFFFLMEFVDGVNLRQLLHAGRLAPREALAIVPQICDALQYAHDQGIVHRDIKPENILLDRRGRVKVADFGLAKLVEGRDAPLGRPDSGEGTSGPDVPTALTAAGKVMGTPNYMAPEQREHPDAVDHRADIYALGVVFYQMLTGELPGKRIEPPSNKVQIDVRLDEVVLRALEKQPERRYQQASVLKTQVETIAMTPAGGRGRAAADTAQPTAAPRFSPAAILGALLIPVFFISIPFWNFGHLGGDEALVGVIMSTLGFISIVTASVLGWVAVGQIRRSGGRLCGLWLALVDGLVLPGLVLNVLLLFGLLLANQFINVRLLSWWYPVLAQHAFLNNPHFLIWLLFATAVILGSNYVVIRGIWRMVNPSANGSAAAAGPGWKAPLVVVAVVVTVFFVAGLVVSRFHPERPFYIGQAWFPKGDYIEIFSVERSTNRMVVKGFYSLVSRDQAQLALHITTRNAIPVPIDADQEIRISKGRGDFKLTHRYLVPGLPHVSMYADGRPFASLYFGTKAESLEESKAAWIAQAAGGADVRLESEVKYAAQQASVQDIVQNLAEQVGLEYDWQKSFAQTDPLCRQWVRNVTIEGKTCRQALEQILKPVGLRYQVENGVLVLSRQDEGTHLPKSGAAAELEFRLVAAEGDTRTPADELADPNDRTGQTKLRVLKEVLLDSSAIAHASLLTNEYPSDEKTLSVILNGDAVRKFSDLTAANPGRKLAIVWRGRVLSAPVIREKIAGPAVEVAGKLSDAEWQVLLDLLNYKAATSSFLPAKDGRSQSFGPVIERVVNDANIPTTNNAIDLNSGSVLSFPAELWNTEYPRQDEWARKHGVDAVAWVVGDDPRLLGIGLAAVSGPAELWNTITAKETTNQTALVSPSDQTHPLIMQSTVANLPVVWLFRTREGACGILQILGFSDNPRGVKIRFKLIQGNGNVRAGSVPAAVTEEPPGLAVTLVSDDVWQATASFRNRGSAATPAFSVLFYAGASPKNWRLISRNRAGPIPAGGIFNESTGPFVLRQRETVISAVVDPENVLQRPTDSVDWTMRSSLPRLPASGVGSAGGPN